jgi:hypothetical protein
MPWKKRAQAAVPPADGNFVCNICLLENTAELSSFSRDKPNCQSCLSTPRLRGIVLALSQALYGRAVPLPQFEKNKSIVGIGMSDWPGYANVVTDRFSYTNTMFHTEPRLDVLDASSTAKYRNLDFILCSDVFEHVLQPVSRGVANLRAMLKPTGALIFSTPFSNLPATIEHFPGLREFGTAKVGEDWVVINRKQDGSYEVFDKDVRFHGGPGTVLEMRIFAKNDLLHLMEDDGFSVELHRASLACGYYWPSPLEYMLSCVMTARLR